MKASKFLVLALLLSLPAMAAKRGTPFPPEIDQRFSDAEDDVTTLETQAAKGLIGTLSASSTDGITAVRVARAKYGAVLNGGASGETYGLGVVVPAKSILKSGYLYFDTAFTKTSSAQLAFQCEDSANIFAAADVTPHIAGSTIPLAMGSGFTSGGFSNAVKGIAADCVLQAVVSGGTFTAGTLILLLEFLVGGP